MFNKEQVIKVIVEIGKKLQRFYRWLARILRETFLYIDGKKNSIPYWATREKDHPALIRYGLVVVLALLALLLKKFVGPLFMYEPPFLFLYSVIVLSAWYGGTRPGFFATFFSTIIAYEFFLVPQNATSTTSNILAAFFFFIEGSIVVGVSYAMHRALQTYEEKKSYAQYYASIAQHISDAVISTDLNLAIQSWNEGAERLYGWRRHEVMDRNLHEVIQGIYPITAKKNMVELLEAEGQWRGEVIHQRRNGTRTYVLTSMSWLHDEHKQPIGIVMVNRDITDRKKLEQGKDDFIALASHELKTPLTSIELYASILKQRFEKNKDHDSMVYLSKIDQQMSKLLELVNHLLDVSKVQAGKIKFNMEEVAFDSVITDVVRDIQQISTTHTIEIHGKTNLIVSIDKDRFRQVIVNILNNAIKYSAQANKVIVTLTKDGHAARVSIKDFGVGIPKEKQDKIFERFYQVTDSKGYTYSGLGLGLFISREIIEKHNGRLWVESEQGKGSTFSVTIPSVKKDPHHYEVKKENSYRR